MCTYLYINAGHNRLIRNHSHLLRPALCIFGSSIVYSKSVSSRALIGPTVASSSCGEIAAVDHLVYQVLLDLSHLLTCTHTHTLSLSLSLTHAHLNPHSNCFVRKRASLRRSHSIPVHHQETVFYTDNAQAKTLCHILGPISRDTHVVLGCQIWSSQ